MPVAAVNKNNFPQTRKDKIRAARKVPSVKAKSKSQPVRQAAHRHLWLGVLSSYSPHHPRPGLLVDGIHEDDLGCLERPANDNANSAKSNFAADANLVGLPTLNL